MSAEVVNDIERVRDALSYLSPDCDRDMWVQIGMSIKNGLGDAGFDMWDQWSAQSDKYDKIDAHATWHRHIKAEGRRTIASLFGWAKAAGWNPSGSAKRRTKAEVEAHMAAQAARQAADAEALAKQHAEAAAKAAQILAVARPVVETDEPDGYSMRKGIKAVPGTFILSKWTFTDVDRETGEVIKVVEEGCLVVQVRDLQKRLHSLQFIGASGRKQYLAGGAKKGHFFTLPVKPEYVAVGVNKRQIILIGEGFASVASSCEATGHASVVAFDAGNLLAVAKIFRKRFPEAVLVFLVDNDQWGGGLNTGYRKAYEAALAVGGMLAVPPFTKADVTGADEKGRPTGPKDWNDWCQIYGHESVAQRIEAAISRQVTIVLAPDRQSATGACYALRALQPGEELSGEQGAYDRTGRGPSDIVVEVYGNDLAQRAAVLCERYPHGHVYILARCGQEEAALVVAETHGAHAETLAEFAGGQYATWFDAMLAELDAMGDTSPAAHAAVEGAIGRAMKDQTRGKVNERESSLVMSHRDEERRRQQRDENKHLQEVNAGSMVPSQLTVEEMLEHCIYIAEGKNVAFVTDDRSMFLKFDDFCALTAASKSEIEVVQRDRPVKKLLLNARLWQSDKNRQDAMTATFHPGKGIITTNPKGLRAVNTWRPTRRWPAKADITPFLEQVEYLFQDPKERAVFLDWLAHIEQKPGDLPHYGWLHIAENTGTGRNWMASVLARVFRGYTAPNIDLTALLDSQYNGALGGCVLGIVDEVQEGASEGNYRLAERLKSMVNAETREINHKYGLKYLEHNAMRWLVFSNHRNALPLNDEDRRFRVVMHQAQPRPAEVYERLYALLQDPEFINAVAVFLSERDISHFKPGERPPLNASKLAAIAASKPMSTQNAEEIVEFWPVDVVTNKIIIELLTGGAEKMEFTPAMRRALEEAGAQSWHQGKAHKIKIGSLAHRVWVLRNHAKWMAESTDAIRNEILRAGVDDVTGRSATVVLADAAEKVGGLSESAF